MPILGFIMLTKLYQWCLITLFNIFKQTSLRNPDKPSSFSIYVYIYLYTESVLFEMWWKVFLWKLLGRPWSSQAVMNHALDQSGAAILAGAQHCLQSLPFHLALCVSGHRLASLKGCHCRNCPLQDQTQQKWVLFSPLKRQVSSSLHCLCSWYLLAPIC